jgi:regulation of enolase protein 1 (concanavalin A-like superfamily)
MAGIMFRENDTSVGAKHINFRIHRGDDKLRWVQRAIADGDSTVEKEDVTMSYPAKLKLTRDGSTFTAYYHDGTNWVQFHQVTDFTMNSQFEIGIAHCSHDKNTITKTRVTNVSISGM